MEQYQEQEGLANPEALSFEAQLALAKAMLNAAEKRNNFIEGLGGFDIFAEARQYMEGGDGKTLREYYDVMEQTFNEARKVFDEGVSSKAAFVRKVQEMGEIDVAENVARMFHVSFPKTKKGIFSRLFK